jgi:ElaB/YqjD/DUF883 family membrane-anchored ribosome-binding protein
MGYRRDRIRTFRHSVQKVRYRVRTRPYASMAIVTALGMIIGYMLISGSKEPSKR